MHTISGHLVLTFIDAFYEKCKKLSTILKPCEEYGEVHNIHSWWFLTNKLSKFVTGAAEILEYEKGFL